MFNFVSFNYIEELNIKIDQIENVLIGYSNVKMFFFIAKHKLQTILQNKMLEEGVG